MYNIYLFQPQYSVDFRNEVNYYLPYAAGCLWSYVSQFSDITENYTLKDIVFKRDPVDQYVNNMNDPKLCGFSCYVWNERYCLAAAKKIKERWPDCIIQFGGPQANSSMTKYNFIDTIVMGEGEEIFLDILQDILKNKPLELFYNKKRLKDLNIPSPYISGVFDNIVKSNPDAMWATTLETNRGCPFACTFCDWGGVTYSKIHKFDFKKIAKELEWMKNNRVVYFFLADANFGIFKERDLEIAKLIRKTIDDSDLETVNIQYAKNSTDVVFEIAKTIGPYSKGITVSVQSMSEITLDAIKRKNLDMNDIRHMMELSAQHGVSTYTELILGLPGETIDSWKAGITELLEIGQHENIDVWFAQLLPNAELASEESRRKFGISSILAADFMTLNTKDPDDIKEMVEIINSTNSMSMSELVECYLYGWMIIHFHINGYTQLISKYARNVKNIPYRLFYDTLFSELQKDTAIGSHYTEFKKIIEDYLTYGIVSDVLVGLWGLHTLSYKFINDHRLDISKLGVNSLKKLTNIDSSLENLQNSFIVNNDNQYPCILTTEYNVFTGEQTRTEYTFNSKVDTLSMKDFYTLRRKGLIKNIASTRNI